MPTSTRPDSFESLCEDIMSWFAWASSPEGLGLSSASTHHLERRRAEARFRVRYDALLEEHET